MAQKVGECLSTYRFDRRPSALAIVVIAGRGAGVLLLFQYLYRSNDQACAFFRMDGFSIFFFTRSSEGPESVATRHLSQQAANNYNFRLQCHLKTSIPLQKVTRFSAFCGIRHHF